MGRQRLRDRVVADLYNAVTDATNAKGMSVMYQTMHIKTVADIAERMEIEDIEALTGVICVITAVHPMA